MIKALQEETGSNLAFLVDYAGDLVGDENMQTKGRIKAHLLIEIIQTRPGLFTEAPQVISKNQKDLVLEAEKRPTEVFSPVKLPRPEETLTPRRTMTSRKLLQLARDRGFEVRRGGKHVQIVAPDGSKMPVPVHKGKDIAPGPRHELMQFISETQKPKFTG